MALTSVISLIRILVKYDKGLRTRVLRPLSVIWDGLYRPRFFVTLFIDDDAGTRVARVSPVRQNRTVTVVPTSGSLSIFSSAP